MNRRKFIKTGTLEVLGADEARLVRSGQSLGHRNGLVEPVYFDADGLSARYRIYTGR